MPVWLMSRSRSPLSRRWSSWLASEKNWTVILSGYALRIGSEDCFQFVLRTRVRSLPGLYDWNLYGPEEKGCRPYLDLVSMSWRTGEAEVMASTCLKSEFADGRWKTIVLASGVSIAFRPRWSLAVSLYGPL